MEVPGFNASVSSPAPCLNGVGHAYQELVPKPQDSKSAEKTLKRQNHDSEQYTILRQSTDFSESQEKMSK